MSTSSSVDVVRPTALRPTSNGGTNQSTLLSVADLFGVEPIQQSPQMPLHHCGSLFERLMSAGTPTGVPPPPLPNAELHTAQSLERELRGTEKVGKICNWERKNTLNSNSRFLDKGHKWNWRAPFASFIPNELECN